MPENNDAARTGPAPTVELTVTDGIAWLAIDRPASYNAIDVPVARDLRHHLEALREDASVRCVVLTGKGKAFCAGGDVGGFHRAGDGAPALVRETVLQLHGAIHQLLALDKPVVAAVNGPVAGAGMGLMMAADLAIASDAATFTMAYTAIAAGPDGASTFFLPRLVGLRRAMELTLTNRRLGAAEALDWGLVNEVVPADGFEAAVEGRARTLAAGPTLAYANARHLLHASFATSAPTQLEREGDGIARMAGTADFREGVAAFVERRRPRFEGR